MQITRIFEEMAKMRIHIYLILSTILGFLFSIMLFYQATYISDFLCVMGIIGSVAASLSKKYPESGYSLIRVMVTALNIVILFLNHY